MDNRSDDNLKQWKNLKQWQNLKQWKAMVDKIVD